MFDNCLIIKIVCVLIIILFHTCLSLESPEREVVLQPRNFNPHPYREGHRHGPVLFPGNPADEARLSRTGHQQPLHQHLQQRQQLQPVAAAREQDEHPYANVARKQRIRLNGRLASEEAVDQENNINPRVYSGLANYAAKVLKKPNGAQHNGYPDPSLAAQKKDYAFSYSVRDHATGDDFSHSQSQNSKATNGEYRVKLPDGRIQTVSYTADKNGYKADVKYSDDIETQSSSPVIVASSTEDSNYDYYDEPRSQVELPIYNNDHNDNYESNKYQPKYVTIYPKHDEKVAPHYVLQDRVHLYHTGSQKLVLPEKINLYMGQHGVRTNEQELIQPHQNLYTDQNGFVQYSTVAPYVNRFAAYSTSAPQRYNAYSTVAPPVRYGPVYITTPRYTAPHGGLHHTYYKR